MCYEAREKIEQMWNGCSKMKEKGRGRNREKYSMRTEGDRHERDMEQEGQSGKRKGWG
jgi:hypothetical protein